MRRSSARLWLARTALAFLGLAGWLLAVPMPVQGHAIGQVFTLPVPLGIGHVG